MRSPDAPLSEGRGVTPSQDELEAAHCWEATDRVPGRPEMTAFRQTIRFHQARWREAHGHPIGSQPIGAPPRNGVPPRPVGSRIPIDYARETGANFLNEHALAAAKTRLAPTAKEPHQSLAVLPVWADLLWSGALTFNLLGDLAADTGLADRAVHTWWPDTPGTVTDVLFEHSPGRLDLAYLGSLSAFDAAFMLDLGDGTKGIVGVEIKYHERVKPETPKPIRLWRYLEIAQRSGLFGPGAIEAVNGTDLLEMWLDHLLLLSMLQHPSGAWQWGRLVHVFPAGNTDFVDACAGYKSLLADESTFASITLDALLDSGALPKDTTAALRDRYLPR